MGTVETREKIKIAAGQLFAERGYQGVTVRDIVQEAGVHLSALNYHFQNKETLYREVLMVACQKTGISQKDQQQLEQLAPYVALSLLVSESLKVYQLETDENWQNRLISRECWEPSHVFDEVVATHFQPEINFISQLIGKNVNKTAEDPQVRFAAIALLGLLETFGLYQRFIEAVVPGLSEKLNERNALAKHLTRLTVNAAGATPTDT